MERLRRMPVYLVASMLALVAVATGNLSGLGMGTGSLLYDPMALPRLIIAVVLTCCAWTVWALLAAHDRFVLHVDLVWAILAGLALWAGLSTATSPHRTLAILGQSERLEGAVTMVLYALVYGIVLQVVRRVGDARQLAGAVGIAAVGLAAYGLFQFAGFDPTNYSHEAFGFSVRRAFATTGNPNFLAGLLVLALPIAAMFAMSAVGWRRTAWTAGTIVVGSALFATFTRGAWLAVLVQLAVAIVVLRRSRNATLSNGLRLKRRWVAIAATAVAMLGVVTMSLNLTGEINVAKRISSAFAANDSTAERVLLIGVTRAAVADRPILGYGPDAFLPAFRAHRTAEYVAVFGKESAVNNAHSWVLQYLVTLGIPGALLLAGAIATALLRARPVADAVDRRGALLTACWIGCVGVSVHMAFNVGVLGVTIPFWGMLGVAMAPKARGIEIPVLLRLSAVGIFAALTLLTAVASVAFLRADVVYLASRKAYYREAPGDPAALAREANRLNPFSPKYARGVAQADAQALESAMMRGDSNEVVRGLYLNALADFQRAIRMSPSDYPSRAWLAAMQARVGTYVQDEALLRTAEGTARGAAALDRHHSAVSALAMGDVSETAITSAASVLPLP